MRSLSILVIALASALLAMVATPAAPARAGDRFPAIPPSQMTPEQKAIMDAIASGPRKNGAGPFETWLASPELADRLQKVGEYVRFHSSLTPRASEFAILLTGRAWNSQFEWAYHYPLAIKAGVDPAVLADLAAGRDPKGMNEQETAIYRFFAELRRDKVVSDQTFQATEHLFGKRGVVDLVAAAGYYDLVCMTLNVAQLPAAADSKAPPLRVAR